MWEGRCAVPIHRGGDADGRQPGTDTSCGCHKNRTPRQFMELPGALAMQSPRFGLETRLTGPPAEVRVCDPMLDCAYCVQIPHHAGQLARVAGAIAQGEGLITPSMIRRGQVILALSNPDPEIEPELAELAGAAFAADGRSVNNVVGYPGIFRGALQAGAAAINVEMKLAAARAIADLAPEDELVPNALDQRVHDAVSRVVREAAERSGVARPRLAAQL